MGLLEDMQRNLAARDAAARERRELNEARDFLNAAAVKIRGIAAELEHAAPAESMYLSSTAAKLEYKAVRLTKK